MGKYKRSPGTRKYRDYTNETLNTALAEIDSNKISLNEAVTRYKIPRRTLQYKRGGQHTRDVGRPKALTIHEEICLVKHIICLCDFGFPLDTLDVRHLVRSYLNSKKYVVSSFVDNCPGVFWVRDFIKRHNLTKRHAANITRQRAAVSEAVLDEYFDRLEAEIPHDAPPQNIWNYDETNVTDDPENKKVIMKRGTRYPERVINSSKSSISLMFCGSAAGAVLPPYVVYKAKSVKPLWRNAGPRGARYGFSKSGWFDSDKFEAWFFEVLLPHLRKINGTKYIIGDNLSSHFNVKVLRECKKQDIKFLCLPPNSTHLTQPLDVAYFRPMKVLWRQIMADHKLKNPSSKGLPKPIFPQLLDKLTTGMEKNGKAILQSGFRKCGIYPQNRREVKMRLPTYRQDAAKEDISAAVMQMLQEMREGSQVDKPAPRHRKNPVKPGENAVNTYCNLQSDSDFTDSEEAAPPPQRRRRVAAETEDEASAEEQTDEDSETDEEPQQVDEPVYIVGDYVIVTYDGDYFPGIVTTVGEEGELFTVKAMQHGKKRTHFNWPAKEDFLDYPKGDILERIPAPQMLNGRNLFSVPQMEKYSKLLY